MPKSVLNTIKTISMIDWNWVGHHPTFFYHFSTALARIGCRVVPFCIKPEEFLERLNKADLPSSVKNLICEPISIKRPVYSSFRPARWRGLYDAWRFFGALGRHLRAWERSNGIKIDLVFFACIYDRQFECIKYADCVFGFPWSGLYLHARSFRMPGSPIPYTGGLPCPEKIFSSRQLHSVAVLDEKAQEPMRKISQGKPVFTFPDFTDIEIGGDRSMSGLAHKINDFACGRPVVSLTGHLQWTKGMDIFTQAAAHPNLQDVFFFLGGEVNWREVSLSDKAELQRAWEELPNVYAHLHRIIEESSLNAVYQVSDVIVAAYRAFPNSSNAVTKAAFLERPIVVSDGYLMAERVRKYGLGEVVPEGDLEALVAAIQKMLQPDYYNNLCKRARWDEYRRDHSVERLNEVFKELVATL
jgi:glycosyltransferase involved in cell wall biosynthesis